MDAPIPSHQIHLKASLSKGELMLKEHSRAEKKKVLIFIDMSESTRAFFHHKNEIEQLLDTITHWLTKFKWNWEIHSSPATSHSWGKDVWEAWQKKLNSNQNETALLISDFHGNQPNGLFWKQLQSVDQCKLIWLKHPQDQNGSIDIDDPSKSQRTIPENFESIQKKWERNIRNTLLSLGLNFKEIQANSSKLVKRDISHFLT